MGYPMNSAGDDIYITWYEDGRGGFFSSNRAGGFGGMDIYSFGMVKKTITGTAIDKNGNLLSAATIELKDIATNVDRYVTTDEMGKFTFWLILIKNLQLLE
ncbi:MAG: carboxypeptidase regulatory-like domain-containing protein [Crocinitomicaceae bacterium]|nr:carboxypeptidase regulatory-like domain-containing protein [Crocinitomicaceae bacterium]